MTQIELDPDSYLQLLQKFPPRPIRSQADLEATQIIIDGLLDADALTSEEKDYLDVLGTLVQDYEDKHIPIPDLSGIDLLRALIDEFGLSQKELVSVFKAESIMFAVLNNQHKLTVEHIEKLANFFHISPAAFFPMK